MRLDADDRALLDGELGPAAARAMQLLQRYGEAVRGERFISIASAHIDGCLYHGPSSIDFARSFVNLGGRVRVPTTLNVAAVDTVHPTWHCGAPELIPAQRELNSLHVELGCLRTLTCAPYQRLSRPAFGQHIAWAESSAIVFVNSVLGARTDRYGDFTDLCAAFTGRVPEAGLHLDENRIPALFVEFPSLDAFAQSRDLYFAAAGYVLGDRSGGRGVPLVSGLPADASEDELKAFGAAAASSGAVALFHAIGITPECKKWGDGAGGKSLKDQQSCAVSELQEALAKLCPLELGEPVAAMCLGTPHFSVAEFDRLARCVTGRRAAPGVQVYVSTSREIASQIESGSGYAALAHFGVRIVVDTCTYLAPVVSTQGAIVTNSAKYAHYGPGNLSRRVGLMTMERCIACAERGEVLAA